MGEGVCEPFREERRQKHSQGLVELAEKDSDPCSLHILWCVFRGFLCVVYMSPAFDSSRVSVGCAAITACSCSFQSSSVPVVVVSDSL